MIVPAVDVLVHGNPTAPGAGKHLAEQENLKKSIQRLEQLLDKAQHYVDDVVVSSGQHESKQ